MAGGAREPCAVECFVVVVQAREMRILRSENKPETRLLYLHYHILVCMMYGHGQESGSSSGSRVRVRAQVCSRAYYYEFLRASTSSSQA